MDKPLSYLDKNNKINPRYCFISYAHRDSEKVYEVLNKLFDLGVNYWYDKELNTGDKWNKKVEEHLENNNCKGCIIFLSKSSINSEAVLKEIEIMNSIIEKREFFIIPILIGYENTVEIIVELYREGKKVIRKQLEKILDDDSVIYFNIDNFVEEKEKLINKMEENRVTENNSIIVRENKFQYLDNVIREHGNFYLTLGEYPQGSQGEVEKISWKLFHKEDSTLYFVTKYAIDFIDSSELKSFIKKIDKLIDAEYKEELCFLNKDLINTHEKDLEETIPTNYADSKRAQQIRLFWVKDGEQFALYNSHNKKIDIDGWKNIPINAGVRLILKVNDNKIEVE